MAAARSLLFQLPRFVSSRLGAHYHASPSTAPGLQRILAADASQKEVAAHTEGDAIVATSRPREVADVAAELLAVKRRAPFPKPLPPPEPRENQSGKDQHHDVPDKKGKEGKQGTRNNYAAASS